MVNLFYLDPDPQQCVKFYHDQQVTIMGTETAQILFKIHHHCDPKVQYPFAKINAVKIGLNICQWILQSKENYRYSAEVGLALLAEYKYRYEKETHPLDEKMQWLKDNIPNKIPDRPGTPFQLSKNVGSYHIAFENVLDACRYSYIDYKLLKKRKWTKRAEPTWFQEYKQKSQAIQKQEIEKLKKLQIQPKHIDSVLGKNWKTNKFMYGKMFDLRQEIIGQLKCGHLIHLRRIVDEQGN